MLREQGAAPTIAAVEVGVPRAVVLFDDKVLLNPVLVSGQHESVCKVRRAEGEPAVERKFFRDIVVAYASPTDARYTANATGGAACVLFQLL